MAAPGVPVMAIVNVTEVLDAAVETVPTEPHDRRVDAVITPRGCLRLGRVFPPLTGPRLPR
jgi:5-formyltetrahydrofolate cyclo-ligase